MLRALPLVPIVLLAGCLYLGDRNDAPRITLSTGVTRAYLGQPVPIRFDAHDDVDKNLQVTPDVRDERGATPDACRFRQIDSRADGFTFAFYTVGTYRVGALTQDHRGAMGEATPVEIEVVNEPPTFSGAAAVSFMSPASACHRFPMGEPVVLAFTGSVVDADASFGNPTGEPKCPTLPGLAYGWRVIGAPPGSMPLLTDFTGFCLPANQLNGPVLAVTSPFDKVCLWPSPSTSVQPYQVEFFASDQTNPEVTTASMIFDVAPDSPPCISGEQPTADHLIVDHTRPQLLQVTGVYDDRDGYGSDELRFVWSVWRQSDQRWYDVPNHANGLYTVDPLDFNVGEELRVRVEAIDRTGMRAGSACELMSDDCIVNSCTVSTATPMQACRKWRTWVLEPR
jgi:hypothetical protein